MAWEDTKTVRAHAKKAFANAKTGLESTYGIKVVREKLNDAGKSGVYPGDVGDLMELFASEVNTANYAGDNVVSIGPRSRATGGTQQEQLDLTSAQMG